MNIIYSFFFRFFCWSKVDRKEKKRLNKKDKRDSIKERRELIKREGRNDKRRKE